MDTARSTEGRSGPGLQAVSEEVSPLGGAVRSAGALRTGELLPVFVLHETALPVTLSALQCLSHIFKFLLRKTFGLTPCPPNSSSGESMYFPVMSADMVSRWPPDLFPRLSFWLGHACLPLPGAPGPWGGVECAFQVGVIAERGEGMCQAQTAEAPDAGHYSSTGRKGEPIAKVIWVI